MTVTVMRDTICCPKCGSERLVTHRQARRSNSLGGILCTTCRGIGPSRRHNDDDLHFWLNRYGTTCPTDMPVSTFIAAGGAPPELVQLAQAVFPPRYS